MYKLIIVDDEVEIRNGLSRYFPWTSLDFMVTGLFENGQTALSYLENHAVDVMLCDISMPVMNGLDLVKALREQQRDLMILLLSGLQDFELARQAIGYNIRSYIVKPTGYDELYTEFSLIKQELDRRHERNTVSDSDKLSHQDKVIAAIKRYVERDYRQASLEHAAGVVHMNADYVSKYFHQNTGQLFSDYVVEVRMTKAAELLKDIRYKTYEISEMVGYSYPKNFTRTFRKYYGMSPRDFRNTTLPAKES